VEQNEAIASTAAATLESDDTGAVEDDLNVERNEAIVSTVAATLDSDDTGAGEDDLTNSINETQSKETSHSSPLEPPQAEPPPLKSRDSIQLLHRPSLQSGLLVGAIRVEQTTTPPVLDSSVSRDASLQSPDDGSDHDNSEPMDVSNPIAAYIVAEPEVPPTVPRQSTQLESIVARDTAREENMSALSRGMTLTQRRVVRNALCLLVGLILAAGAILGGLCGLGTCRIRKPKALNRMPINSTEELYEAVDAYFAQKENRSAVLSKVAPIETWDVSRITNFARVFDPRRSLSFSHNRSNARRAEIWLENEDLSAWDMSSVTTIFSMFAFASNFNGDVSTWNTSSVTNMSDAFLGATQFAGDVSLWNVSKVQSMSGMFQHAESFESDLSEWDVSNVQDMRDMFADANQFSSDLSRWNMSNVQDLSRMFAGATSMNFNLCDWGTSLSIGAIAVDVFLDSGCPATSELVLPFGPFCLDCALSNFTGSSIAKAFETTEELYQAVDAYLASIGNPRSPVALIYGYPIGSWNVGKITNFSR
jgi:surface protein